MKGGMGVRKLQVISICILIVTLAVMGANRFIFPLSDWVIRVDAIVMMAALFTVSFSTVKCIRENS